MAPVPPAPASAGMVLAGLRYLAAADPTALAARPRPSACRPWSRPTRSPPRPGPDPGRVHRRAGLRRRRGLSPTAWLIHRTRISKAAARVTWAWPAAPPRTPRSSPRWPRDGADREMAG